MFLTYILFRIEFNWLYSYFFQVQRWMVCGFAIHLETISKSMEQRSWFHSCQILFVQSRIGRVQNTALNHGTKYVQCKQWLEFFHLFTMKVLCPKIRSCIFDSVDSGLHVLYLKKNEITLFAQFYLYLLC